MCKFGSVRLKYELETLLKILDLFNLFRMCDNWGYGKILYLILFMCKML